MKNCGTTETFNSVDEIILDVVISVLDLVNWLTFSKTPLCLRPWRSEMICLIRQ